MSAKLPLARFRNVGWDASANDALLRALCTLEPLSSEWPRALDRSTPREAVFQIYEACRGYSAGTLTVRNFDKWIDEWTARNGGPEIKSAYHRISGRLHLEPQHVAVFLDCLFSRWGALPPGSGAEGMKHGWVGAEDSKLRYFGLPVEHPSRVRDRILSEVYPSNQPGPDESDIGSVNATRLIVGRYNVILGPPRGWSLQAFHALASEKLARGGTLIFVVDLGQMRSDVQRDFHAYFNFAELHTALMTLATFDREVESSATFALPAQRGRAAWTGGVRPARNSGSGDVWKELQDRIVIAVAGLPDELRMQQQDAGKQTFRNQSDNSPHADEIITDALKTAYGVEIEHIFPRVDLAHTLALAELPDPDFLSMNVWIESATPNLSGGEEQQDRIGVTHSFFWTLKDQRSRFGLDEKEEARRWWEDPAQYVGGTKRRPFAEARSEVAFSMLQQAAFWRLGKVETNSERELGIKSYVYLSERLNISVMTLDEFITLPYELYRKHHPNPQNGA